MSAAKFKTSQIVTTANALNHLTYDEILSGLLRHVTGDWGDLGEEDRKENDLSLKKGHRLLSVYHVRNCIKFWIITKANRSKTTVMLPEDY
jgi:hypothetical protein